MEDWNMNGQTSLHCSHPWSSKIGIQAHFLLTVIIPPPGLKNCCLTLRILKWITWILASTFMVTIMGISLSHNSSLTHFSGDGPLLSLDGWSHWYPQGASICSWASHSSPEPMYHHACEAIADKSPAFLHCYGKNVVADVIHMHGRFQETIFWMGVHCKSQVWCEGRKGVKCLQEG